MWCGLQPNGAKDKLVSAGKRIPIKQTEVPEEQRIVRKLFGKYLLLTNTVSAGVLMIIGDLVSQEIEYRAKILEKRYDWQRVGKYA